MLDQTISPSLQVVSLHQNPFPPKIHSQHLHQANHIPPPHWGIHPQGQLFFLFSKGKKCSGATRPGKKKKSRMAKLSIKTILKLICPDPFLKHPALQWVRHPQTRFAGRRNSCHCSTRQDPMNYCPFMTF